MKTKNNGGPAFPIIIPGHTYGDGSSETPYCDNPGMSLRDWFAGQVMQALIASHIEAMSQACTDALEKFSQLISVKEVIALNAYAHADAMLAEREKTNASD